MPRLRVLTLLGLIALLVMAGLLLAAPAAQAQSGGEYDLTWNTVDGGGTSSGGGYTLTGTVGQADAGTLGSGGYAVGGGFWASFAEAIYELFLPVTLR
jgi:hypothetical protein